MTDVLTYSDSLQLAKELVTAGNSIAQGLGGKVTSIEVDGVRGSAARGPVLLLKSEVPLSMNYDLIASALMAAIKQRSSQVILIGSTKVGRMVAAKLAVVGRMCVLSDVEVLKAEDGRLTGIRGVYAGKFNANVEAPVPCIALIPQGAYEEANGPPGPVEEMTIAASQSKVSCSEARASPKSSLDLRSAKVIVAAGRGIKKKEDLALVEKLAKALGGVMGASRPLSSDLGWLGEEYHIGLTGVYVRPNLYLAIGISGQLQHVAGIKDSKVIAVINKDKQAPIFQVADYGVVGDLYEVVPALLKLLGAE